MSNEQTMTPEQMRIAIAEACGWSWEEPYNKRKDSNRLIAPGRKAVCVVWSNDTLDGSLIPDYLNDLNAMAEAEKHLPKESRYLWILSNEVMDLPWFPHAHVAFATALQRATAFLRALGKL